MLFPNTWAATTDAALIKAGETRQIPEAGKDPCRLHLKRWKLEANWKTAVQIELRSRIQVKVPC